MDRGLEKAVRPVRQEITYVYQNRRRGIRLCARWMDRDWLPSVPGTQNLEPWLISSLEEQRDAAIVAVGTRSKVVFGIVSMVGPDGWVLGMMWMSVVQGLSAISSAPEATHVKKTQDAVGRASFRIVSRREPVRATRLWVDLI